MGSGLVTSTAGRMHEDNCPPPFNGLDREQQAIFAEVLATLDEGWPDMPALPDLVHRLQDLLDAPDVSADRVVSLIAADPVVSMRIIRTAKCVATPDGSPVNNLRDAVPCLGYRMLRNMVMNVAITRLFQASSLPINHQLMKFWKRSREVAANSYVLAQQQKHLDPDDAMLVGLLHDIGALPLCLYFDRRHPRLDQATLEEMVCRFSAPVGTRLLQSWNFPKELIDAATNHEYLQCVDSLAAADYADVVTMASLLHGTARFATWKNIFAAERLGYYAADCRNFLVNHAKQLAVAREMLGIGAARH